jgi:hypothetical protein
MDSNSMQLFDGVFMGVNIRLDNIRETIAQTHEEGAESIELFYERHPKIDYVAFFNHYTNKLYTETISNRFARIGLNPEYRLISEHIQYRTYNIFNRDYPNINYYTLKISWER